MIPVLLLEFTSRNGLNRNLHHGPQIPRNVSRICPAMSQTIYSLLILSAQMYIPCTLSRKSFVVLTSLFILGGAPHVFGTLIFPSRLAASPPPPSHSAETSDTISGSSERVVLCLVCENQHDHNLHNLYDRHDQHAFSMIDGST